MRGFRSNTQYCSFCGKPADDNRPLVAGPSNGIFICNKCIAVCQSILDEQQKDLSPINMSDVSSPKEFKEYLDEYVIGQDYAKKVLN